MAKEKKSKHLKRYRISIIEDDTHKHIMSLSGSRFTMIAVTVSSIILLFTGIILLISYTPLRLLIPGYPSAATRQATIYNAAKLDSLEKATQIWALQLTNIQRVVEGREPLDINDIIQRKEVSHTIDSLSRQYSKGDSLIRQDVMNYEKFNITNKDSDEMGRIEGMLFFTPVKGVITETYNKGIGHPYIDIAAAPNSVVCAVLNGTIISADWSDRTGYTIQIQHENNLVSVYKHNARLLKKTGDRVTAGTPVAVIGEDGGTLSTGPHLHFELWHKGEPIDPSLYIKF